METWEDVSSATGEGVETHGEGGGRPCQSLQERAQQQGQTMPSLLPGQPVPLPPGPAPQPGPGTYARDAQLRSSVIGVPVFTASCDAAHTVSVPRTRPHAPSPGSVVLGTVTRLSPGQALLSIGVVDGVPLPAGEEFTGLVRTQDVRATEKDRVKIGDCFRGGDVVRGVVVRVSAPRIHRCTHSFRSRLGTRGATL